MEDGKSAGSTDESVITLQSKEPTHPSRPVFVSAQVLPGSGMMILQIGAHLPGRGHVDVLVTPPEHEALATLRADAGESGGNKAFSMGGAILLPFANRIRGKLDSDGTTIATQILGQTVNLPANWGGQAAGAERYAMHGLTLASHVGAIRRETSDTWDRVSGSLDAGNFGGHWLSSTSVSYDVTLRSDSFSVCVTARNVGAAPLPMGIGWHPYFAIPSGHRAQARIHIPASKRVLVNNYDEVLPTGDVVTVAGSQYDFSAPDGRQLDDLYLDDCFVDIWKAADGHTMCQVTDGDAAYGLRIVATSPHVKAVQVYAPVDKSYVALEPQFNWADPFGAEWPAGTDTGMVTLQPGELVTYAVRLELFTP
ncbi:MAG: aldose 1-epimerase [Gemmatimonadaceae bacterium]